MCNSTNLYVCFYLYKDYGNCFLFMAILMSSAQSISLSIYNNSIVVYPYQTNYINMIIIVIIWGTFLRTHLFSVALDAMNAYYVLNYFIGVFVLAIKYIVVMVQKSEMFWIIEFMICTNLKCKYFHFKMFSNHYFTTFSM